MSARKKESSINLLPQTSFATTTTGRVLTWVLSTFRIVVIVTEIIVMIAFLSRFWLDAQNSDLAEEIETKQAALVTYVTFEEKFRDTQTRLKVFSELSDENLSTSALIKKFGNYLPENVYLSSATLSNNTIRLEGFSDKELNIQQYIANLQADEQFKSAALIKMSTKKDKTIIIEFVVGIDDPLKQPATASAEAS